MAGELPDCKRKAAELELFMEDLLASSDTLGMQCRLSVKALSLLGFRV